MPQKGLCIGKARLNSKVEDVRLMSARRHCAKRRNGRICGHGFLQPADAVRRAPLVKASFRQGGERQMAKIGRASGREEGWRDGEIWVVAGRLKKKKRKTSTMIG